MFIWVRYCTGGWQWLPGNNQNHAANVAVDGSLDCEHVSLCEDVSVRPALWVNIESGIF